MSLSAIDTERERLRRSLYRFFVAGWPVIEAAPFQDNWHLKAICDHVQALITDAPGSPQNLIISVPPGTCKSLIFSVFAPAWKWLTQPAYRMLYASGAPSVVTRDSMRCRTLVKSEWYQRTFKPDWQISKDQDEKQHFANTAGGWRKGMAAGSGVTGERADFLGVDDPNDAKEIHSKAHREAINEKWWATAFHNRIADPSRSKRGLIQQRLHEEDLTGYLLTREKGDWAQLALQMEYDPNGPGDHPTFLGWEDPRTSPGQLLMPERFTPAYLAAERRSLGSANYAGQMQQLPAPSEGNRFKREWWRFYTPAPVGAVPMRPRGCTEVPARLRPRKFDRIVGSWDMAFKDTDGSDYVVGITVGCVGADRYVLACKRARMGFGASQEAVRQQRRDWPACHEILIEDKANGSAIIETLSKNVSGIIAVNPEGGKEARASVLEPEVEAGNWFLPEGAEWVGEWVEEFASFPLGRWDDQVDAASQVAVRLNGDSDVNHARMLLNIGM